MTSDKSEKGFTVVDRRGSAEPPTKPEPSATEAALSAIDFATFVMSLASSVLIHLGELTAPGGESRRDLGIAKQTIDILGMLEEKTRGNLTADESKLVEHLLYDLRIKYVEAKKRG